MNQKELQQTVELLREAAQILADISVQHPEATEVSTWRWPVIDELLGSAAAFEEDNEETCRTCDGTGWFYGDADLSWCGCGIQPFYGYWLYHECDCGGILTSWAQYEQLHASDPLVERVSWERYKQAYEDGWDVEWTENEEL